MNKVAIAGKGGSGKTTIAGILARTLARHGELKAMPRSILQEQTDEAGKRKMVLGMRPAEVARTYGIPTPDGPTLLLMGTVDHAGAG